MRELGVYWGPAFWPSEDAFLVVWAAGYPRRRRDVGGVTRPRSHCFMAPGPPKGWNRYFGHGGPFLRLVLCCAVRLG